MPKLKPGQKLVILDLDETLFYSTQEPLPGRAVDFWAEDYAVYLRPEVQSLFTYLRSNPESYAVMVWSTSNEPYVRHMVDQLGLTGHVAAIWCRDHCYATTSPDPERPYIWGKDLARVRRVFRCSRSRIIAIDNSPIVYRKSYGNLVAVPSFFGEEEPGFSMALLPSYLDKLKEYADIRPVEKRGWWRAFNPFAMQKD